MISQVTKIDSIEVTPTDLSVNDSGKLLFDGINITIKGRRITTIDMVHVTLGFDEKSNPNEGEV